MKSAVLAILSAILWVTIVASGAQAQAPAEPYDLNDLSILLPLPESITQEAFLSASAQGSQGTMIPRRFFDALPVLTQSIPAERIYSRIQAVAFRIDPPANEVRIVWQPLVQSDSPRRAPIVYAIDAALHAFYKLPAAEMDSLLAELGSLKAASGVSTRGKPLWVHPAIRAQGLQGAFSKGLRAAFLKRIGEKRLTRLTFMTIRGQQSIWDFAGYDVRGGELVRMAIPRTGGNFQTITNSAFPNGHFQGRIMPEPKVPTGQPDDTITSLIQMSGSITTTDQATQLLRAIRRIEDPRAHNPDTMDCVSCHAAQPARLWIARFFPSAEAPNTFSSRFNLENASPKKEQTDQFRAFGYHLGEVAVSTRVIQETALLAEQMNGKQLARRRGSR